MSKEIFEAPNIQEETDVNYGDRDDNLGEGNYYYKGIILSGFKDIDLNLANEEGTKEKGDRRKLSSVQPVKVTDLEAEEISRCEGHRFDEILKPIFETLDIAEEMDVNYEDSDNHFEESKYCHEGLYLGLMKSEENIKDMNPDLMKKDEEGTKDKRSRRKKAVKENSEKAVRRKSSKSKPEFPSASGRKKHMNIHMGKTPYTCQYCNKNFELYLTYFQHFQKHKIMVNDEYSDDTFEQAEYYCENSYESLSWYEDVKDTCEGLINSERDIKDLHEGLINSEKVEGSRESVINVENVENLVEDLINFEDVKDLCNGLTKAEEDAQDSCEGLTKSEEDIEDSYESLIKVDEDVKGSCEGLIKSKEYIEDSCEGLIKSEKDAEDSCEGLIKSEEDVEDSCERLIKSEEDIEDSHKGLINSEQDLKDSFNGLIKAEDVKDIDSNLAEEKEVKEKRNKIKKKFKQHFVKAITGKNSKTKEDVTLENSSSVCSACGIPFRNRLDRVFHYKQNESCRPAGYKLFKCEVCQKEFSSRRTINEHMNIHTGKTPYTCQYCDKTFKLYLPYYRHILKHKNPVNDNSMSCLTCGVVFTSSLKRIMHYKKNKPCRPADHKFFKCEICPKEFSSERARSEHMNFHTFKTRYTCQYCGKKFEAARTYYLHVQKSKIAGKCEGSDQSARHEESPIMCSTCGDTFTTKTRRCMHYKDNESCRPPDFKLFMCDFCQKGYSSETKRNQHMHIHTMKTPYACQYCHKKFASSDKCLKHAQKHRNAVNYRDSGNNSEGSEDRPIVCSTCDTTFTTKLKRSLHYKENESCRPADYKCFKCKVCEKEFSKANKRNDHMNIHTDKTPYTCQYCGKKFKEYTACYEHVQKYRNTVNCGDSSNNSEGCGDSPIVCSACGITFATKLQRSLHYKENESCRPADYKCFKCKICEKEFSNESKRNDHMNIHTGKTPYTCQYCGETFKVYSTHYTHVLKHRAALGKVKPKICQLCHKTFASSSGLKRHELLHRGVKRKRSERNRSVKNFLCNYCAQKFRSKGELETHIRGHTGEKPFICNYCNKSFKTTTTLRIHKQNHLGIPNKFQCKICSKSYSGKFHFETHLRTHTGEKPYTCTFCGKSFNYVGWWKIHTRKHTGETPYACPICGDTYSCIASLNNHQRKENHLGPAIVRKKLS